MKLSVAQIAEATGAALIGSERADQPFIFSEYYDDYLEEGAGSAPAAPVAEVTGVSWDSREVQPGWLYVALEGERVDGHDFAGAAVQSGACAVMGTRALELDVPMLVVPDCQKALADLAGYWRGMLGGRVVGLTGSNGKTTTKNLVRDVLSVAGPVTATLANQNNELGVPRTLLAADADASSVVVEMGMRGLGQIAELAAFAKPDWGLITNVGESHIELLGSREAIARAKAELFEALPDERGIAFVNAADDYAEEVCRIARLQERGVRIVLFGGDGQGLDLLGDEALAQVWASKVALDGEGRPSFSMNAVGFDSLGLDQADGSCECTLALRGMHNVSNACSAAAVGLAAGLTLAECCEALAGSVPEQGRQVVMRTPGGAVVIDDSYNANADSMKASLATFAAMAVDGRRIAVLGDMLELGDFARECHERVGRYAAGSGLDSLVCVGTLSEHIASAAREAGMPASAIVRCQDAEEALAVVSGMLEPGDALLVKASHSIGLEKVCEGLVG